MFFPLTRIVALAMAGVLCFGILVPLSLAQHKAWLAVVIAIVYLAYLAGNVILWRRMRPGA